MNNAAAISAVNRALAHYRRRQAHAPTDHSAREITQMSMLAEYLHETHTPELGRLQNSRQNSPAYNQTNIPAAA